MRHVGITLFIVLYCAAQQWEKGWIDTVIIFRPGAGQNFGQDSAYFPRNIFGPPDTSARLDNPSASPFQIVSLGMGGEIVVGFHNKIVVNGPGVDFVIFENSFVTLSGRLFAEPALVSVSPDGVTWRGFPWDSLTLQGCAGVTPTNGNAPDLLEPAYSGGDWFDLAALNIDSIRYIRIADLSWWLLQRPSHPLWDPTLSGFDLDAVGSRYLIPSHAGYEGESGTYPKRALLLNEPCFPVHVLGVRGAPQYRLHTMDGRLIRFGSLEQLLCVPYRAVVYLLQLVEPPYTRWLLLRL
ncbi:MAG: hypothetical protein NZ473_06495 [Candidatus Kapabacteria bacterium]|nr:hypothetical protein [Candidatus Kapabacteria bacterium]MDW8225635.1 hypothetical protein [Bacteroidota bacterium]